MNHNAVVTTLEQLIPDILKTGDPGAVLLKHASEKNLSPAQLTRLGQYYNIAKTHNHLKKASSEDRGSSFPMVDVEDLEDKYTKRSEFIKGAAEVFEAITEGVDKSASITVVKPRTGNMRDIYNAVNDLTPAANVAVFAAYPAARSASWGHLTKVAEEKKAIHDEITATYMEAKDAINLVKKAFEDRVRTVGFDAFNRIELDICGLDDTMTPTFQKLAAYLVQRGLPLKRASADDLADTEGRLYKDTHQVFDLVKQASELFDVLDETIKVANMTEVFLPSGKPKANEMMENQLSSEARAALEDAGYYDNKPEGDIAEGGDAPAKPSQSGDIKSMVKSPSGSPIKEGVGSRILEALGRTATGVGDAALSPIRTLTGDHGAIGKVAPSFLEASKKTRMGIDEDANDVQGLHNLHRIMNTDEIVSKADPDAVVAMTRELMRARPDILHDRFMLTMALREGLAYGAPPVNSVKTFMELNKLKYEGDKGKRESETAAYGGDQQQPAPERKNK